MKQPPSAPSDSLENLMILQATEHVRAAEDSMKKSCRHALMAGMRLVWLHRHTAHAPNGVRVPRGTREGFEVALEKIGLARRTAYRWMNATLAAADKIGISPEAFPTPGEAPGWDSLENWIADLSDGMSLNRLVIGCASENSDDQRQEELITRAEAGDITAEEVLEKIASGKLTLVQAMRAAAGALATRGKERRDPVYLDFDSDSKAATGLLPKALVTLRNGFVGWNDYSPAARAALREEWQTTRLAMPDELFAKK